MRKLNQSYIEKSYLEEVIRPEHHHLNLQVLEWAKPVVAGKVKYVAGTMHYLDWDDRAMNTPL